VTRVLPGKPIFGKNLGKKCCRAYRSRGKSGSGGFCRKSVDLAVNWNIKSPFRAFFCQPKVLNNHAPPEKLRYLFSLAYLPSGRKRQDANLQLLEMGYMKAKRENKASVP
jgi:hypothetical protein